MKIRKWLQYLKFDNCVQAILERVFFRSTGLQVLSFRGIRAICDHRASDAGSVIMCLTTDMYQTAVDHLPGRPLNVLDIGANAGGFTLMMLAHGHSFKRCVAVELNPATAHRARFNIESNSEAATVLNGAVTCDGRSVTIALGPGSTSDSIYRSVPGGRQTTVPGLTMPVLLDMFDGPIDLCKMDIEGAESEVLLAPNIDTLRRVQRLVIELHHQKDLTAIEDRLREVGLILDSPVKCGVNVFMRAKESERQ